MNTAETVLATVLTALVSGGVPAWFTYRTARDARRKTDLLEKTKVDAAAYTRAKEIYDSAIQELRDQCVRTDEEKAELRRLVAALRRNETKLYERNAVFARAIVDLGGNVPPWTNGLE